MYRGLVCIMRFRIAISICAIASSRRWYDFHTSFGKQVAFYQEVPQYRHIGWVEGDRHKRTHVRTVRIFPDFPSVCASNPSLLSGWFMERRGCSTVRDRAKVLDVGVAKWFDEISIRGENILSSFFLDALKTDGTVVASVGEETVGRKSGWYLREIGEFTFRI